jgi:hypothetical protein
MKLGMLSVKCEKVHTVMNFAVKYPNRISKKLSCGLHSNYSNYRLQTTTHFFQKSKFKFSAVRFAGLTSDEAHLKVASKR